MYSDVDFLEQLRAYYAVSKDYSSKVVDFSGDKPSEFLRQSEYVSEGKSDFTIVDVFRGVMPIVLDYDFLVRGQQRVGYTVEIYLDSNVVSYLHLYVSDADGAFRTTERGLATHKLLRKLAAYSERGWHFNQLFYLLEAVSKNDFEIVYPHVQDLAASIMTLQLMNSQAFLDRGVIKADESKAAEFSRSFESASVEAVAASDALWFATSPVVAQLRHIVDLSHVALLKIVLLDRSRSPAIKKVEEFNRFLLEDLGQQLTWELLVACLRFAGRAGTFLSPRTDPKSGRKTLLASAWDLVLLRLPEITIMNEPSGVTTLSYICTAEKALQRVGRLRTVGTLASSSLGLPPVFQIESEALAKEIGTELARKFVDLTENSILKPQLVSPISRDLLKSVTSELQGQI